MEILARRWSRITVTLLPLLFALLHATGVMPVGLIERLDQIIYDARLRATLPRTLDERIVIVDIDEKSLAEIGRWPWGRDKLAALVDDLFERQKATLAGFDIVFPEADDSAGLASLRALAAGALRDQPGFAERLRQLEPGLDHDAAFARALHGRPVVLGYYFTSDREGFTQGVLPAPVMQREALQGRPIRFTRWTGYGANIEPLARSAPIAGFFNPLVDSDGVVRGVPLLAQYQDRYYESLGLAMFRALLGLPAVEPGFPPQRFLARSGYAGLESLLLRKGDRTLAVPVEDAVCALVPYRGPGGPHGGSFRYVSAADLVLHRLADGSLKDKVVLVGTTAPGLQDLRVTPVGPTYAGVEAHASLLSGLLDGRVPIRPDYAVGYDLVVLVLAGLTLAFGLPRLSARGAMLLSAGVLAAVAGLNFWFFSVHGLVLPLAAALVMCLAAFGLDMGWGYLIESRSKRELVALFGTCVPPELVDEMVRDPDHYGTMATRRELTVMFCELRGFTGMSERMAPTQVQALLNQLLGRLTAIISRNRGTLDKYMGNGVMAFWGAPVEVPGHALLAVKAALELAAEVRRINEEQRERKQPGIAIGIGLSSGLMCVGDMGSAQRHAYTVIGDAVALGARVQGLCRMYGVDIVASEATRAQAGEFAWQELDRVRLKGKGDAVAIFSPVGPAQGLDAKSTEELRLWSAFLRAWRRRDRDECGMLLLNLERLNPKKFLYELYSQRLTCAQLAPEAPGWDGTTNFDTK